MMGIVIPGSMLRDILGGSDPLADLLGRLMRPAVITLCGSTRFKKEFRKENERLTHEGFIVLSVGSFPRAGKQGQAKEDKWGEEHAAMLDDLHKRKIDISDSIHVINPGGYIGRSTAGEIIHAYDKGLPVTSMEPLPSYADLVFTYTGEAYEGQQTTPDPGEDIRCTCDSTDRSGNPLYHRAYCELYVHNVSTRGGA